MMRRWLAALASAMMLGPVLLLLGAASVQASSAAQRFPSQALRTAHIASPCGSRREVAQLVKEAEYPVVPDNFYPNLSYCAKPFSVACAAQQFNREHDTNVPFYKDAAFYHRCEGAYALLRRRSHPRSFSYGLCGVISWAALIGGPWVPEATLPAKLVTVIFGVSLKLKCG
jgi:hypothetical protein